MISIDEIKFDEKGLVPAIVVDYFDRSVLTLAYMNRESLEISMREGKTCFYSRSRKELWRKGETSGNYQHIVDITADCDSDALVVSVIKDGPACHTGSDSCFTKQLFSDPELSKEKEFSIDELVALIRDRRDNPREGSYTNYLFDRGIDKILKKVGEESTEVIIAGKAGDKAETVYEISDLVYHVLVLMIDMGIAPSDILSELKSRHVIDKKVKQEKMTK